MSVFNTFEEIEAWKEGRVLVRRIRTICRSEKAKKDFPFVDQVTRASRSVCANIAEGFESLSTPEFIMFLGYAKRSAGEVRSHLYDARDEQYISMEEFNELSELARKICSMLAKLIHYLQSVDQKQRRTLKQPILHTNNQ